MYTFLLGRKTGDDLDNFITQENSVNLISRTGKASNRNCTKVSQAEIPNTHVNSKFSAVSHFISKVLQVMQFILLFRLYSSIVRVLCIGALSS